MNRVFTQKYVPHHCHEVMETAKMFLNDASRSTNDAFILIHLDQFESKFFKFVHAFLLPLSFFCRLEKI